jgi:hypothetical protein
VNIGFHFGTVYVRGHTTRTVLRALDELMGESEHEVVDERGLDPTPDEVTYEKVVRSFAVLPPYNDWVAVMEDGHSLDDGGVAEGLSDILRCEALHVAYSDPEARWEFAWSVDGQPVEAGGADDTDYDVSAMDFTETHALPHFGVYYEEVAAAADHEAPALAGSLTVVGDIRPLAPIGTEIRTYRRPQVVLAPD